MLAAALFVALAVFCAVCRAAPSNDLANVFSKQNVFSTEGFTKLHVAIQAAIDAQNSKTGLRAEAVATAASWAVIQTFSGKACTASTLATAYAVGLAQCYPAVLGTVMATISGTTATLNSYTTADCTGTATVVESFTNVGTCDTTGDVASNLVVQTTAGPTSTYPVPAIVYNYYGTTANCQSNSGPLYGWSWYGGSCVPLTTTASISLTCSGSNIVGTSYSTSAKCTGASASSGSIPANSLCAATYTVAGAAAVGPYVTCTSAPAAAEAAKCFAGSETVELASGAIVSIAEVKVGDKVLAFSASAQSTVFSDVVATPHPKNNQEAVFQHIVLASGKDIKMTADHLVAAGKCDMSSLPLSRAADVHTGDCVQTTEGMSAVVSNSAVSNTEGVYTIVTDKSDDLVVVNGIVASPFAVNHAVANAVYNVHRVLYSVAPKLVAPVAAVMSGLAAYFTK